MIPEKIRGPDNGAENAGSAQREIPDFEIDALARCLLPKIQAYFESPEGQAAFQEWKKQHDKA